LCSVESSATDRGAVPCQPQPQVVSDLGLAEIFVANLVLKHCFFMDIFTVGDLVERLKLSTGIVSQLLEYLKRERYLEIRAQDGAPSALSLAHRHALTEAGKRRAGQLLEYDAYVGPAPVSLEAYWQQVMAQSISLPGVTPPGMQQAFQDLVVSPGMLEQLGVAAVSGKPLFLYGPPGNGKTSIALRLGRVWGDAILVPYAILVAGNVIRVFDAITHKPVESTLTGADRYDRRWVRCRRPAVVVGGELTLGMLDLSYNPMLKYYEAPLQLKANNGMFIVDDFGRQQLSPQGLLNRWIIPLENSQDYLCLHTGQKFAIPFDQFIVFATNLEPNTLVDAAFLRRLRSKVKVDNITREQFVEIFRRCCEKYGFSYEPAAVTYLLATHYDRDQRALAACQPRDILELILDYARFHQLAPSLTPENLDRACRNYFV
jgi:predicted ATPase with chaperone activity